MPASLSVVLVVLFGAAVFAVVKLACPVLNYLDARVARRRRHVAALPDPGVLEPMRERRARRPDAQPASR